MGGGGVNQRRFLPWEQQPDVRPDVTSGGGPAWAGGLSRSQLLDQYGSAFDARRALLGAGRPSLPLPTQAVRSGLPLPTPYPGINVPNPAQLVGDFYRPPGLVQPSQLPALPTWPGLQRGRLEDERLDLEPWERRPDRDILR